MQTLNHRKLLRPVTRAIGVAAMASALAACVSAAPGADKVRLTKNPSEVGNCTAVGNIEVPGSANGQVSMLDANNQFRNQVVGLGGNTAFITSSQLGAPVEGVAYRCP